MKDLRHKDNEGRWVYAGDKIAFCYGIPPVVVIALVYEKAGALRIYCPGHKPETTSLRGLRRLIGSWTKVDA
jgi:hypothetical protein